MVGEGFALSREELVRTLTAYSGITTADGASGGTSLICSDLIGETFLTRHNKSILIMSGDAQYETAGIESFVSGTGEIIFTEALSTQIVAGVSFRVLNILPGSVHIMGYDLLSGEWRRIVVNESGEIAIHVTVADIVTAKISGQAVVVTSGQVLAKVSGETIATSVSGNIVIAKISGETVIAKISGESLIVTSGQVVSKISGESVVVTSGLVVAKVSGETVSIETPTFIKTGPVRTLSDASGGVVLHSGAVKAAVVKALSDNSGVVLVGGSGDRPWYEAAGSAQGFVLAAGEAQSKDISDFNQIYVVAQISGDKVCFDGVY